MCFRDEVFEDKLLSEEVDSLDGDLQNNSVLIEVETFIYDFVDTKSGLHLIADNTFEPHEFAVRHGIVRGLPKQLTSWKENKQKGLHWITEMQIQKGDVVWFMGMAAQSTEKVTFEGRKFLLLHYEDLYVAKRNNETILCLNGNVLLEPIYKAVNPLLPEIKVEDCRMAKVAYIGLKNTEYRKELRHDSDIEVGNTVFMSGIQPRHLEMDMFLKFDGKKYIVCQNYELKAILEPCKED